MLTGDTNARLRFVTATIKLKLNFCEPHRAAEVTLLKHYHVHSLFDLSSSAMELIIAP